MMPTPDFLTPAPGSFRDPSGFVFLSDSAAYRTITDVFQNDWNRVLESGFARSVVEMGLLVPFEECPSLPGSWKTISSPRLPVISYPYEWCFSQLKDAALLTLTLLQLALRHGLVMKDASAFNVQFIGSSPIFIDHLSFEIRKPDKPWPAYLQFCRHFLAPLALYHYRGGGGSRLPSLWIEGLPLGFVSSLLPLRSRFSPSLQIHVHMHARFQDRRSDGRKHADSVKRLKVQPEALEKLCQSLCYAVEDLRLPKQKTQWAEYYSDTNYSKVAAGNKSEIVETVARKNPGRLALDLGANTGEYSRLLAPHYDNVVAADADFMAVEQHYLRLAKERKSNITPLVFDLTNPSPALGFNNEERSSFFERFQADMVTALAILHHLTLGSGIPLARVATCFSCLLRPGGTLVLEFVPSEDSQIQRLMAVRTNVFADYSLEGCLAAFSDFFTLESKLTIQDSCRIILIFKRKPYEKKTHI
jgi:SAM-dependent methyltransferase